MISCSSSTASSTPATSRKVIFGESADIRLARDLPNDITFEPPPWTWFIRNSQKPEEQHEREDEREQAEQLAALFRFDVELDARGLFDLGDQLWRGLIDVAAFPGFFVAGCFVRQLDFEDFALVLELDGLDFAFRDFFGDERL